MSDGTAAAEPLELREWAAGDLAVVEGTMGAVTATRHLGGPEPAAKLAERHARYLALAGSGLGRMFVIVTGPDAQPAGSVGFWDAEWAGARVYEMGWSVLPAFWGQGIATRATVLALAHAREAGKHRRVHAFPSVENLASNAVCRKAGFTLAGEVEVEYPKGRPMRAHDWRYDL
ncbi:GNAT family N-acetyltransferase [Georgenia yuyongxinii]|uniref:GNAT family N-acetyltransferase n=1 Tax=Georgenia yuyongxinii TaxID=2589797 RepID=A0A5B8BYI1_9MICO|nr:GNAT family N-acetyltransferase [Georgenia yuyongxinii]QDC23449.1 GNAT family N-acetyltransferase [Georgenia yuyongxinii]